MTARETTVRGRGGGAGGGGAGASAGPLLLGVRHHGPGSARAVLAALEHARPDAVLVEGPPEADALLPLAADARMRPPVALLVHAVDDPGRAAFWPMAAFSPEWVAIRWALAHQVPVRFMDLPAAHALAVPEQREPRPEAAQAVDPIGVLAATAGYDDAERWWEDVVEHRTADGAPADPRAPFAALAEAMGALREAYGDGGHPRDAVREASMRLRMRAARKEFGEGIAVVCGAWHVPALAARTTIAADKALLRGIPKVRTETTWVPWTHRRLARHSGYGAGIESPGWYGHLFDTRDRPVERWMTKVAGLFREQDRPVSSADVIEAVRLAGTLAAMRGRPAAGLAEATDAVRAVMCEGSDVPLALVQDRLVVGEALGTVPDSAPAVPLQRDLTGQQRRLRLRPVAERRDLELDLRKDTDAARSRLLHRLRLLGVEWGRPVAGRGGTGTFRESWRLHWQPEMFVRVAEAGVWGTTVLSAASARAESDAVAATALAEVTVLAERCLLAGLPDALSVVMSALADRAALDADVGHLADALPALARSLRYGDVRGTDTAALSAVAAGLAERICVGLPPACTGLGPEGAEEQRRRVDGIHTAVALIAGAAAAAAPGPDGPTPAPAPAVGPGHRPLDAVGTPAEGPPDAPAEGSSGAPVEGPSGTPAEGPSGTSAEGPSGAPADGKSGGLRERWSGVLRELATRDSVAGVVRGRATRLLLDDGHLPEDEAARLMALALSPGAPPVDAAAWIEGFVGGTAGGGMLLVHDERLLRLVDGWLTGISPASFTAVLPLLRRTFSTYDPGVRRNLGELVRRGPEPAGTHRAADASAAGFGPGLDGERADAVEPVLRLLLGLGGETASGGAKSARVRSTGARSTGAKSTGAKSTGAGSTGATSGEARSAGADGARVDRTPAERTAS